MTASGRVLPITIPLRDWPLLSAKQALARCEFQVLEGLQAARTEHLNNWIRRYIRDPISGAK